MEEWLTIITRVMIVIFNAMALVVITYGTFQAFLKGLRAMIRPAAQDRQFHEVWLRYARWLVGSLSFQLAADIIETTIAPGWEDIGRLAAIAAIRTFLNFFLERDLAETGNRK